MTRDDIKEAAAEGAREGVKSALADHEGRINSLEATRDNLKGGAKAVGWVVGVLIAVGSLVASWKPWGTHQ